MRESIRRRLKYTFGSNILNGPVAQRLEQGTHNPLVVGSNPTGPTIQKSLPSIAKVFDFRVLGKGYSEGLFPHLFRKATFLQNDISAFEVEKTKRKQHSAFSMF